MTTDGSTQHLLLVDDEAGFRDAIADRLTDMGFVVTQAGTGEEALERLGDFAFDIIITDLRLPGISGREVLDDALARYPDIIAIVITGFGTVREAVEITRLGAEGFITKPFQFEELAHEINAAIEKRRLKAENAYLRAQLHDRFGIDGIVGRTKVMMDLFELLRTVAATTSTVLITGETGTGKELAARAIHDASPRRAQRFVAINCSAIPETLLEAELFGHVRGAFTGAVANRIGRIEQAHRGTLFLDEIAEMTAATQAKLLRVLQERTFRPLGGQREQATDIRVIAATNVEPLEAVRQGKLREDLYYRLNVFHITLPPLRERKEDIPLLAQAFVREFAARNNRSTVGVSDAAMRLLDQYHWPGNVRELRNVIERAVIVSRGDLIEPADLPQLQPTSPPPAASPSGPVLTAGTTVDEAERQLIEITLAHTGGNKTRAAEMLGISLKTLHNKLNRMKEESASRDA